MGKIINIAVFILFLSVTIPCFGQDITSPTVNEIKICLAIEDREPIGVDDFFPNIAERLYCFTRLSSDTDTTITHVWYYENQEKARMDLDIKAGTWRTWSVKRIIRQWTGEWRVDVLSEDGTVLDKIAFVVKSE